MPRPMRCRITGCDLDECGVCRRCGSESQAHHQWQDRERKRPCFRLEACEVCGQEREQPDHDWEPVGDNLKCTRCGLSI